nr:reverse transcriptase domain-containing protein [Tanacetum cinerariifolium]
SLLSNKKKLFEFANTPLNENFLGVLLKKLPNKLRDPGKFLIPCDFSELEECLALPDLGASINLMRLSVWKKLSLPELNPTCMTLELANRSVAYPVGVTFSVEYISRYSYRYDDESVNRIDVIDIACEEYAQKVLGFSDSSKSGNPTPSDRGLSYKRFNSTGIDDADFDSEGDIILLEKLLNDEPSSSLPPKELYFEELKIIKSSIDDPLELDLNDLPSHLENKYILVAIDYLSKWVEAKALPTNDTRVVVKILKSLFARFGTPRVIISDHVTHFCNDQFAKVILKYGVTHRLSTAYHPQTSRQVEVSNGGLKRILERTIGENQVSWSDKLDDLLWAFHTAFKTPIGCTPIFSGKLKTRWTGPLTITQVFLYGTVELSQTDRPNFKVNGIDSNIILEGIYHPWLSRISKPSPWTTKFEVESGS